MKDEEEEEEEEHNWFARWDAGLPKPEELMPLSQTLISPDLALAFDIPPPISHRHFSPAAAADTPSQSQHQQQHRGGHQQHQQQQPEFDAGAGDLAGGGDDLARTLKRPRLVWTPQLHKRFVDAVAHLGIKNAVPKTIMQLMSVDGLTRENVASHLQKYRLYLKRMQGIGGGGGAAGGSAEDQIFASAPVPHHFLSRSGAGTAAGGPFMPFVPVPHHHQIAVAQAPPAPSQQQLYYQHQRHIGHYGSPHGNGGGAAAFSHGIIARPTPTHAGIHRILGAPQSPPPPPASTASSDSGAGGEVGERKILTLFPTGGDNE